MTTNSRTIKLGTISASVSRLDSRLETRRELERTPLGPDSLLGSSMTVRRGCGGMPIAANGVLEAGPHRVATPRR